MVTANEHVVTLDRISVKVIGDGPDLIFLPGLSSSRDTWAASAARLKDFYRLHLVQVAGFAGEPTRANAQGDVVVPTAEAIDAYITGNNLAPATMIGHSLGGTMILYLAELHPDHIERALIVDALPFFGTLIGGPSATPETMKPIAEAIRTGAHKISPAEHERMMATMAVSPQDKQTMEAWGRASDPSVVARATAEDMTLDLRPGLVTMGTPITLIYPDYTPLGVPTGMMDKSYRTAYAAAPHINFVGIERSLHCVMFDQPEQFQIALDSFLGE